MTEARRWYGIRSHLVVSNRFIRVSIPHRTKHLQPIVFLQFTSFFMRKAKTGNQIACIHIQFLYFCRLCRKISLSLLSAPILYYLYLSFIVRFLYYLLPVPILCYLYNEGRKGGRTVSSASLILFFHR